MALFTPKPTEDIKVPEKTTEETVEYNQSTATVFENLEQPVSVSATLDGSPWNVLYLNQVLREDDVPRQLDLGLDPSLQQYIAIKEFVISVTDSLSHSRDTQTGITTVTGAGQLYPSVQVTVGDMFVGKQKDNKLGIFRITSVTRMQYIAGSAFEVEYQLYDYYNANIEANVNSKIIKTFIFDESKVACGKALLDESMYRDIGMTLKELTNWYYDLFYDLASETFLWPYQKDENCIQLTYDHFCVAFFSALLDYDLRGLNPEVRVYSCLNGSYRDNSITVWDTLMTSNPRSLSLIKRNAAIVSPSLFQTDRMYNSITATTIDYVMWPGGHPTLLDSSTRDDGDPYVFSDHFYDKNAVDMSLLEMTVLNLINGGDVSGDDIDTVINSLNTMSKHDLYHAIPVVIWLLKAYSR